MVRYIIIGLLLLSTPIQASGYFNENAYCNNKQLGWHFYCDKPKKEDENKQIQERDLSPLETLEAQKKELEEARALAVLKPTEENVKSYLNMQLKHLNEASYFADQWRRVLWKSPNLDYTYKFPVNSLGKQAYYDQQKDVIKASLEEIRNTHGLIFIYKTTCRYCHTFSKVLRGFSMKYAFPVLPVSIDGKSFSEWPNTQPYRGQLATLGQTINQVPATFLFDKRTKKITPVGYGMLSEQDLVKRIFSVLKRRVGDGL